MERVSEAIVDKVQLIKLRLFIFMIKGVEKSHEIVCVHLYLCNIEVKDVKRMTQICFSSHKLYTENLETGGRRD